MTRSCRVMIIDDEFIMRQGIRYMVDWEKEGYEIVGEASNGKEALDKVDELYPDIILCDIVMPVMDGLDFMKVIKASYPSIQIIVLSGYDRFDYVRQALVSGAADYVLKPTLNPQELLKIVTKAAQKIPGLKIKQKESSELDIRLEKYFSESGEPLPSWETQQLFGCSCFRLFVVPLRRLDTQGMDLSPILYEKTGELMKDFTCGNCIKFIHDQEMLCVVLNYNIKDDKSIPEFMENIMRQLSALHDRAFGILGPKRSCLEELKKDFQMPGFMEEEIFYHRGNCLYLSDTEEPPQELQRFDFRKFAKNLGERRLCEAAELFHSYMYHAVQCRMPEFKLKNQAKNLLYNIVSSVDDRAAELEQLRKEYFEKIDSADYCDIFLKAADELTERLQQVFSAEQEDIYLKKILEYIQVHYREDLDLKTVAEIFNFNYSYLSAYFNSHMKEGFSEYLNRVRIEKACEYLAEDKYSISKISSMTGYSDHSYFCRVFKKITGKTPSVYKRERK